MTKKIRDEGNVIRERNKKKKRLSEIHLDSVFYTHGITRKILTKLISLQLTIN